MGFWIIISYRRRLFHLGLVNHHWLGDSDIPRQFTPVNLNVNQSLTAIIGWSTKLPVNAHTLLQSVSSLYLDSLAPPHFEAPFQRKKSVSTRNNTHNKLASSFLTRLRVFAISLSLAWVLPTNTDRAKYLKRSSKFKRIATFIEKIKRETKRRFVCVRELDELGTGHTTTPHYAVSSWMREAGYWFESMVLVWYNWGQATCQLFRRYLPGNWWRRASHTKNK